jgi:hypothetical protein
VSGERWSEDSWPAARGSCRVVFAPLRGAQVPRYLGASATAALIVAALSWRMVERPPMAAASGPIDRVKRPERRGGPGTSGLWMSWSLRGRDRSVKPRTW